MSEDDTSNPDNPKKSSAFEPGNMLHGDGYTTDLAHRIAERITAGESIGQICRDDDMPSPKTIWEWKKKYPVFRNLLMQSQIEQMFTWSLEIVGIAEDAFSGRTLEVPFGSPELRKIIKDGVVTFKYDKRHVDEAKLLIDTKKWLMERIDKERFGLKQFLDIRQHYYESSDEDLVQGFVASCRRAGVTPDDIAKWFEDVPHEETRH